MSILLMLHSIVRWIIVLVAVVAIVKLALGWLRGGAFKGMDRGLVARVQKQDAGGDQLVRRLRRRLDQRGVVDERGALVVERQAVEAEVLE